jgi:hypothetical protein
MARASAVFVFDIAGAALAEAKASPPAGRCFDDAHS